MLSPLPMIQPSGNLYVRQEYCRTLAPLHPIREGRSPRSVACLEEPGVYSPATSPTASFPKDYTSRANVPAADESRGCGVPSIQTLFAIADRDKIHPYDGGYYSGGTHSSVRRPSSSSEYSWQGSSSSAPEMSPHLSTAHTSPTVTPVSPGFPVDWHGILPILPILPQSSLKIDVRLAGELHSAEEQNRRRLELSRPRRPSARQAPYAPGGSRSRRGSKQQQHHQPPAHDTTTAMSISSSSNTEDGGGERQPHFNQPYTRSVKLFILYYKDDCKYGWPAINARRVELLPVLLGESYKREVEENRKVAGINGFYYRLNAMMPALTPDGSGLLFVEKDGRFWEFTESSKCRTSSSSSSSSLSSSSSSTPSASAPESNAAALSPSSTAAPTRSDARPRGMVDRYPEEVVHYWEEYVRHFVPPEKHAEVYAKAKRYCEIRAEQRREKGVPQWTPDNEAERVIHKNPPDGKSKASKKGSNTDDRMLGEMMSAFCALNPTQ